MKSRLFTVPAFALAFAMISAGCSDPLEDKPGAVIGEAIEVAGSTGKAQALAGVSAAVEAAAMPSGDVYAISTDSYIGFAGSKIGGVHYGQFLEYEGIVSVVGGDLSTARIDLTLDMSKLSSDDSRLTGTLKGEDFFDVENYPAATFLSTSVEKADDGYTVTGNLTIREITKSVSFPAQMSLEGETLTTTAEFTIDRNEWGIGVGWVSDTVIKDNILMEFDVTAELRERAAAVASDGDFVDAFSKPAEGSKAKATEGSKTEAEEGSESKAKEDAESE